MVVAGAVGATVVGDHLVDDSVGWYPVVRPLSCALHRHATSRKTGQFRARGRKHAVGT